MSSQMTIVIRGAFGIDVYKVASAYATLQHFGAADEHTQAGRQTRKRRGAKPEPATASHGAKRGRQRGFNILANPSLVAGSEQEAARRCATSKRL
jgi:hypothetical protein